VRAVYMGTNVAGRDLSDPAFTPVFERCQEFELPVFLHPLTVIGTNDRLKPFYLSNLLGNPFDTAIAAAHLVLGGVLDRFPRLHVLLPHAGGAIPYLAGRVQHGQRVRPENKDKAKRPFSAYLRRFTYDTISHSPEALSWLINTVGADPVMLGSGLSLIFGVMRVVNLAHGSYFMLGGYVGLSVVWRTGSFAAAVLAGAVAIGLIGIGMERLFLRRLPGQTLGQVLMTIGFALIFQDLALLIWGGDPYSIAVQCFLQGPFKAGALSFPAYRIFIIVVAVVVAALLWLALDQTRAGARIRAAVDDG